MESNNKMSEDAIQEFALQKGIKASSTEEIIKDSNNPMIALEMNRFIDTYIADIKNEAIPKDVKFERIDANGVPVEWVSGPEATEDKAFFHLFGGGYAMGVLETRKWSAYLFWRTTQIRCLNVGYRLAPEHPFPAALEDSVIAYRWLLSTGIKPGNVIIGGGSAGGGLTVATLLKLKELNIPLPRAAVLLSPWVDLTCRSTSLKTNAKNEPLLASVIRLLAALYAQKNNRKNPFISPVYANLEGLPPMLIQVGSLEILLDECKLLAERAKSMDVDIILEVWEDMIHGFQDFGDNLRDSQQALEHIGEFVQNVLKAK